MGKRRFGVWILDETDPHKKPMQAEKVVLRYPLSIKGVIAAPLESIESLIEAYNKNRFNG